LGIVGQKLVERLKTWVCGLALLGLVAPALAGQQLSFNTITEGLGNLNINCLAQDRAGYMWVGTENGLYRYDGRVFRQFGAADGLRGHIIQSLYAGPDGTLFVGTTTGIFYQRPDGQFGQIHPPAPVTDFSQRIGW
jgi:ligand-binding sensor domain-containing protein